MATRTLIWVDAPETGWACSDCPWKYPVPTLLTEKSAREAYDRLASAKFDAHSCDTVASPVQSRSGYARFAVRARALILRGFLPKTAIEMTLHELESEFHDDPKAIAEARRNAEAFLHEIRKGSI